MKENPYIKKKETIEELSEIFDKLSDVKRYIAYDDKFVIEIFSLDGLHYAIEQARRVYKDWSGKIEQIWNGFGETIFISYADIKYPLLQIWFETDIINFPKELLPNKGCKFEKQTNEEYVLVCPTGVE